MNKGLRSVLFGMHNPIIHGIFVYLAWIRIYHEIPSLREIICILFHDIGYIKQNIIDGDSDKHPEMGAKICGQLFGKEYYNLCIAHSRDYANKLNLSLSKLGYADKYCVFMTPNLLYLIIGYTGGEAKIYFEDTKNMKWCYKRINIIKEGYKKWWINNCEGLRKV